jgi:hypothetical protein
MDTTSLANPRPIGNGPLFQAAMQYHRLGWSVLAAAGKKPHRVVGKWAKYQTRRPDVDTLKRWFGRNDVTGILVITGPVSGDLVVRDFDDPAAYPKWKQSHPRLAPALPVVKTRRGHHVYFKSAAGFIGQDKLGDGELRGDSAHFVVAPPSIHPDGGRYTWVEPFDGSLTWIEDPVGKGLTNGVPLVNGKAVHTAKPFTDADHRVHTADGGPPSGGMGTHSQGTHSQRHCVNPEVKAARVGCVNPEVMNGDGGGVGCVNLAVNPGLSRSQLAKLDEIIDRTIPREPGHRNVQSFGLARELKALAWATSLPLAGLCWAVRRWHKAALPNIRTKDFAVTWEDFLRGWANVTFPVGTSTVDAVFGEAVAGPPPSWLVRRYGKASPRTRLAVFCEALSRGHQVPSKLDDGVEVIYLDCRNAGRLLGVSHRAAARHFLRLCDDGVLDRLTQGRRGVASEYVWVGDRKGSEPRRDGR